MDIISFLVAGFLAVLGSSPVQCYNDGPPISCCSSMIPGHGVKSQDSDPPFKITLNPSVCYFPGDTVSVTVSATDGDSFKGMLVQARVVDSPDTIIGTFEVDSLPEGLRLMDCSGKIQNAVSHSDAKLKESRTIHWLAPNTTDKDIFFRATVVRAREQFWTNITSTSLKYDNSTHHYNTSAHVSVTSSLFVAIVIILCCLCWE